MTECKYTVKCTHGINDKSVLLWCVATAAAQRTRTIVINSKHMSQHVYKSIGSLPDVMHALHLCTSSASSSSTSVSVSSSDLRSFEVRFGQFRFDSKVTGRLKICELAAPAVVPQITLSLFNKNFNHCAVVIEIYFMFMILCLCSKSIHTR